MKTPGALLLLTLLLTAAHAGAMERDVTALGSRPAATVPNASVPFSVLAASEWAEVPATTPLAALVSPASAPPQALLGLGRRRSVAPAPERSDPTVFSAHRAAVMLRSLTMPGWGQATLGRRHAAAAFGLAEAGVWSAYAAFKIQELMRTESYVRTAKLYAGIDLRGRDEEYLRIVGGFASSDDYNLYVVTRDAANQFMQDPYHPDMEGYRAYIAAHSLGGRDAWSWADYESFRRYGDQRKRAQRAALRANTVLAVAVANRILSALHAARNANRPAQHTSDATSWNLDLAPGLPGERMLLRAGVRARF